MIDIDRVVIMAVDRRYPEYPRRVQELLRPYFGEAQVFLNGRGGNTSIDLADYDLVHTVEPPAGWTEARGLYDYWMAYRYVVRQALADGVDSLLITEDDIELSPNFDAIMRRCVVPEDMQILYYGAMHYWATIPAQPAGPYLVRLNGGQCGTQAVLYRRAAMKAVLELPVRGPIDWAVAGLHSAMPCYCVHPAVIRQAQDVQSDIDATHEPFTAGFLYDIRY